MRKILVVGTLLCIGVFLAGSASAAPAADVQRPIQDFVDAQGTYCIDDGAGGCFLVVPPVKNFLGWGDPATGYQASVDYAGLADDWAGGVFGTETKGSVTERPLADGRAEVHVRLFTKDALTWVVDFTGPPEECVWQTCPLKFGGRWTAEGGLEGEPALGASFLEVKFINTAPGAPLPDLVQLVYFPEEDQETEFLAFRSSASGQLPNGTPGRAIVVQTGLFGLLKPPVTNENWDGFPAELIRVLPVGQ